MILNVVWQNRYMDSLRLMRISKKTGTLPWVDRVSVIMATPLNKQILGEVGMLTEEGRNADSDAMMVAVDLKDEGGLQQVLDFIEEEMKREIAKTHSMAGYTPKTVESAIESLPDANLALISVPGQFAKAEAMKCLRKGLHVFLFSDNVSVEEELELKQAGRERGLLVMGPGCGTAIINGAALGFANALKAGPVGFVAAAGTGLQETTSLLSNAGIGTSHAFGSGGRDLTDAIRGITTRQALDILDRDAGTSVIVIISKLPGPETIKDLAGDISRMRKPVIANFPGISSLGKTVQNLTLAPTLEEVAKQAGMLVDPEKGKLVAAGLSADKYLGRAEEEYRRLNADQKYVRGLFSGGTLCSEATLLLGNLFGGISSNMAPLPEWKMKDTSRSSGHVCIDLGDEEFTTGRAHPMIDPFVRCQRLLQEARDPETAVILLDVVLGYGSHEDMAGALGETIREAKSIRAAADGHLCVVACVVGTFEDPQDKKGQEEKLSADSVLVLPSNAQAARMAALIASRGRFGWGGPGHGK